MSANKVRYDFNKTILVWFAIDLHILCFCAFLVSEAGQEKKTL